LVESKRVITFVAPKKGKRCGLETCRIRGRPAEIRINMEGQHFGADFLWKFLEIMKHKKKARCTNFVNSWRGNLSERD